MNIIEMAEQFQDLKPGAVFMFEGEHFQKIDSARSFNFFHFNLATDKIKPDSPVQHIPEARLEFSKKRAIVKIADMWVGQSFIRDSGSIGLRLFTEPEAPSEYIVWEDNKPPYVTPTLFETHVGSIALALRINNHVMRLGR